ncbi:DUF3549 family protein [Simiduia curdlanivorans]|uniref:DUF3549 family protein n=1 Tax=Simiduia curdlanivorans TaxID=1492769 RepID=A0ABV8UZY6_9GAMM|nr:DUF3549 family protein [Simiduia curdlanivorans]MDN3639130.1 DUF3549 family protein [Simiduia curdlanivorans]
MQPIPSPISSITDLLARVGLTWRAEDCGARIQSLDKKQFTQFEQGNNPYPYPYLGQAHLALVVWGEGQAQAPHIWFLRFDLDEQAKMPLKSRDEFVQQLLFAIGTNLAAAEQGERLKSVLDNNPYVWQPNEALQAAFHARLTARLKLAPSQFYQDVLNYFSQGPWDYWQALGLQGLADLVARHKDPQIHTLLVQNLGGIPEPVFKTLSCLLEHEPVDIQLTEVIVERLTQALQSNNPAGITAGLRALSSSSAKGFVAEALKRTLEAECLDAEAIVTLATRHGHNLIDKRLTLPFLEQVAHLGQASFNRVLAELLFQPSLRPHFLAAFRDTERSERLSQAIGGLLGGKGNPEPIN